MDEELLLQMLSDPEMASALSEMGVLGDRQSLEAQKAKRAQGLIGTPSAEGRTVGPHSVYVASSPLEHLGVAFDRGLGTKQLSDATAAQEGLISGDVANKKKFAGGLQSVLSKAMDRWKAKQGQPAASPAPAPGYGASPMPDSDSNDW